jgi:predicted esterase
MKKSALISIIAGSLAVVVVGAGLGVGNYIYTSGTAVECSVNADDVNHTPAQFFTGGLDSGPFPGDGWNKWVGHDLSQWWLVDHPYEDLRIDVGNNVQLAAWWIEAKPETRKTVIVTHGIGTSKQDFNTLLPSAMLVKGGFNVLLVDSRDAGESTCTDGRHSAGQEESSDFAQVAKWLNVEKKIPASSIGMFGVSGGAIATSLLPAKTNLVSAFAMEGTIFDFNAAATKEVEFQGFPGFLWQLAQASALLFHGVNLAETSVPAAIKAAGDRPLLVLHGDIDQRLDYQSSVDYVAYAESVGAKVSFETFVGADHTEGMLSETERYANALVEFFRSSLR